MTATSPEKIYEAEKQKHETALQELKRKQNLYGWLRLLIIVVGAITAFYVFNVSLAGGGFVVACTIGFFLWLVSRDTENNKQIAHRKALVSINEDELDFLSGRFQQHFDGAAFLPHEHHYAHDLDLLGPSSVFQYINRGSSEQGRALLAQNLLLALPVEQVLQRQDAIRELAPQYEWRQQWQAILSQTSLTQHTEKKVEAWIENDDDAFTTSGWKLFVQVYSVVMIALAVLAVLQIIPGSIFFFIFVLSIVFSNYLGRSALKTNSDLTGIVKEVDVLSRGMQWVEEKQFSAPQLQQLQRSVSSGEETAHQSIGSLKKLLDRFDLRFNWMLFLFLNGFLLWDVRQLRALNAWKKTHREQVPQWYALIAEMEVLSSLATLHFNQPAWAMPTFSDGHFTLSAKELGHPLLPSQQRVCSDFSTKGKGKVALITGSNMAGKSTFLRSLGVNVVLAQMGAAVCANEFLLSPNQLMTSMRIADNLAESTSTFYAELKKLKTIIEAVNRHEPVFILLDEILRGTNSLDKHTGSEALIRQLIREDAVAVLATHDVELSKLEDEYPNALANYHFDVQVSGEELYFDYKLKPGVCTNLNASILMKKIGIDV
ncbi:MAG: MutS-related protein [Flavisolibacter sp.]